jgi:hypothetical protein
MMLIALVVGGSHWKPYAWGLAATMGGSGVKRAGGDTGVVMEIMISSVRNPKR